MIVFGLLPAAIIIGLAEALFGTSPSWRAVIAVTVGVWAATSLAAFAAPIFARALAGLFLRRGADRIPPTLFILWLAALWPAWHLVAELTSGPRVARRADVESIRLAASLATSLAAASALVIWRARSKNRLLDIALIAIFLVAMGTNVFFLPAQYAPFHLVVAWCAVGAGALVCGRRSARTATSSRSDMEPGDRRRFAARLPWLRASSALVILGAAVLFAFDREPARGYGPTARLWNLWLHVVDSGRTRAGDVDLIAGRWGRAVSGRRADLRAAAGGALPSNVLLVTIDALRARSVGALGCDRDTTPFLDELAREAIVFERAYAQSTFSLGSILSTFTGRYPGALNVLRRRFRADADVPEMTLAESLRAAGWHTSGVPAFMESELRSKFGSFARGFDVFLPKHASRIATSREIVEETLVQLRGHGDARAFTWMHLMEVHEHKQFPGDTALARYDTSIRHVDAALREFFSRARSEGLLDDTLVVVHGDHGEEFMEHGGTFHGHALYEEQIHVPLLMTMAGLPPRRVAEPVELVDLVPTVWDVLGVEPPVFVHGDSLVPAMLGEAMNGIVFAQLETRTGLSSEILALVDGDRKVIALATGKGVETYDLAADRAERRDDALRDDEERLLDLLFASRAIAERVDSGTPGGMTLVPGVIDLTDVEAVRAELASGDPGRAQDVLGAAFRIGSDRFVAEIAALLMAATDAGISDLRQRVLQGLEVSPSPEHAPSLIAALAVSPSPDVTRDILMALVACGDASHVGALRAGLAPRHPVEQAWGLVVAARWGDATSVRALDQLLAVAGDGILLFAYRVLGGVEDSVFRDLTIAGLLAPEASAVHDYVAFAALTASADPALGPLLYAARDRFVPLPETLASVVARGLAPLADRPWVRAFLEDVLDRDTPEARLDALDVLRSRSRRPRPEPTEIGVLVEPRVTRIARSPTRGPLLALRARGAPGAAGVFEVELEDAAGGRRRARALRLADGVTFLGVRCEISSRSAFSTPRVANCCDYPEREHVPDQHAGSGGSGHHGVTGGEGSTRPRFRRPLRFTPRRAESVVPAERETGARRGLSRRGGDGGRGRRATSPRRPDLIEREVGLEARLDEDGVYGQTTETLRPWSVGPYRFRLVLAISAAAPTSIG